MKMSVRSDWWGEGGRGAETARRVSILNAEILPVFADLLARAGRPVGGDIIQRKNKGNACVYEREKLE